MNASSQPNALAAPSQPQPPSTTANDLNVAICGTGVQGLILIDTATRIRGTRFRAVCDIWPYNRQYAQGRLRKYNQAVNTYEDYRELLDQEKDLDAVIVATPDWMHAEITNACLQAGKHVYCEKEMSNSLAQARSMVLTQRQTGKLLQIGHQRRSNPRYRHAINRLIHEVNLLGRVTHAYAQWNNALADEKICPKPEMEMSPDKLQKYGYGSMRELLNWRWFKKYGGGPIVDLGSHQIDLFSWVFGCNPTTLIAAGGADYYKGRDWYDNVLTIYEFDTPQGRARAFYQVLTTTRKGGFYEVFMGTEGTITISEVTANGNRAQREAHAPPWDLHVVRGLLGTVNHPIAPLVSRNPFLDVRASLPPELYPLPVDLAKLAHQPHLENFFNAIRGEEELNCPADLAYETAVAVLKANEAVNAGGPVTFTPEEFKVG